MKDINQQLDDFLELDIRWRSILKISNVTSVDFPNRYYDLSKNFTTKNKF